MGAFVIFSKIIIGHDIFPSALHIHSSKSSCLVPLLSYLPKVTDGRVGSTLASCSEGPGFKARPWKRLS
jgi:hypothetical protein